MILEKIADMLRLADDLQDSYCKAIKRPPVGVSSVLGASLCKSFMNDPNKAFVLFNKRVQFLLNFKWDQKQSPMCYKMRRLIKEIGQNIENISKMGKKDKVKFMMTYYANSFEQKNHDTEKEEGENANEMAVTIPE